MATTVVPNSAKNRKVGMLAAGGALAMLGLGYASVPLYQLFCQVTGYGGTTQRADATTAAGVKIAGKSVTVRFDANVARDMPWEFKAMQVKQEVRIGQRQMARYQARNLSGQAVTGTAIFNVSPEQAGKYFNKIQCFCFTEQTLQPGQEIPMPVIYYVDPAILDDPAAKDIAEITLSYTFNETLESAAARAGKPVS
ncbi:MAG: cytochrome c oxidase assembly protein [Novosphingobium sp. 28-62-57]|uniref:cytochrome c oxidase assembly protein n=1 Tax=unclassified Novosphingobium TaxID=2644732 RepID=UPI000BDDE094|nr:MULTISPECIES: cytochrome c oxidase assembly protein [unclassified Novosphingobium]OYW51029.1 MAG: cytochrome c oxidase assembly protein [Novosphingobium sp. 12-62-10]OYZ11151.1 MAG: cytochrome c oxidase assembly protein [Novosphingobium sp. 28-62-57]OZA35415.1 MAG: cytochrome c oxidase assembly protein [Novosphingobium sp. 17-62-9]